MNKRQHIENLIDTLRAQRSLKGVIAKESALQRAISAHGGIPVVDGENVHFFFEHDKKADIWIVGDWNNWKPGVDKLQRIHPKSVLYHLEKQFPNDARLSYRFVVGGAESINDPNNERTWQEVFGNNTYFTMPAYKGTPYLDEPKPTIIRGEIRELEVRSSRALGFSRTIFIYVPEKLRRNTKYHFLYVHDGEEAIRIGKFTNVLDNLRYYEPELPQLVAVFIPPGDRHKEYMMNKQFAKWCATSLVKQVEKFLGVKSESRLRALQGASLGGLCAAYTGMLYANVFGNIAAQSPSFWVDDHRLIKAFSKQRRLPLRFFLHTGTVHDALVETRAMFEVLNAKGYPVTYLETSESHNWANWSVRYAGIIRWLVLPNR
jgi:enterochelin esterase family protein